MHVIPDSILNDMRYKNELSRLLSEADAMLAGKYVFNGIWDMEPCDTLVNNQTLQWNVRYNDDPEWSYMFTRFDFVFKLITSFEVTCDVRYIDFGYNFICQWFRHSYLYTWECFRRATDKVCHDCNCAYRTLDIAILSSNIAEFAIYCHENHLISNIQYVKLQQIVNLICWRVFHSDNAFKTHSNWGLIESGSILCAVQRMNNSISMQKSD